MGKWILNVQRKVSEEEDEETISVYYNSKGAKKCHHFMFFGKKFFRFVVGKQDRDIPCDRLSELNQISFKKVKKSLKLKLIK